MFDRILRAIKLDAGLYRQVADNHETYMGESAIIAVIVAIISSIGVLFSGERGVIAYVIQVLNSLIFGWILWSWVAYFIGTKLFNGRSNFREMLCTLGFANAPRLLGVLGFIPCIGWLLSLAGAVLSLIAGVIAIRESMEFDTGNAVVTALVGLVLYILVSVVVGFFFAAASLPFSLG
jgi:hypothetical protein